MARALKQHQAAALQSSLWLLFAKDCEAFGLALMRWNLRQILKAWSLFSERVPALLGAWLGLALLYDADHFKLIAP